MSDSEPPKKISADKVEIIDQTGQVIQEAQDSTQAQQGFRNPFGTNIRVFHSGPMALLLVPILLPLLFVIMIVVMLFALLFGKSVFRVFRR